jgi:hypothetical protein
MQAEAFKKLHGRWPKPPVRCTYLYGTQSCEGDIDNHAQIFGFPGMCSAVDPEVTKLVMLRDADGAEFPKA